MLSNGVHHRRFDVRSKSVRRKHLHENISVRHVEAIRQESMVNTVDRLLMLGECLQVDFQGLRAKFHDTDSCLMLD